MRKTMFPLALITACVLAPSPPASGATLVVTVNSSAQDCYWAARARDTTAVGVCTFALKSDLMPRDRAATLINRSALRILKGDLEGGVADCEESIATYDRLGEAHLNRAVALREMGRPREALEAVNMSIKVGLRQPQLGYYDRALAKEDLGDVKGAYLDLKKALEIAPGWEPALLQLKRFRVVSGA
ncbi:MAG: tetratricopeptide repeat protein [Alphaproteobacteria bacterium]